MRSSTAEGRGRGVLRTGGRGVLRTGGRRGVGGCGKGASSGSANDTGYV